MLRQRSGLCPHLTGTSGTIVVRLTQTASVTELFHREGSQCGDESHKSSGISVSWHLGVDENVPAFLGILLVTAALLSSCRGAGRQGPGQAGGEAVGPRVSPHQQTDRPVPSGGTVRRLICSINQSALNKWMTEWMTLFRWQQNRNKKERLNIKDHNMQPKKEWAEAQGLFVPILYHPSTLIITDIPEHF